MSWPAGAACNQTKDEEKTARGAEGVRVVNRGRSFCSDTAAPRVKMSVEASEARLTPWGQGDTLAALPVFTLMSSSPDVDSLRLSVADFDAFLPDRATSNAFT